MITTIQAFSLSHCGLEFAAARSLFWLADRFFLQLSKSASLLQVLLQTARFLLRFLLVNLLQVRGVQLVTALVTEFVTGLPTA